jgi:hypothetical protein
MIAIGILILSGGALAQFLLAYCRALLLTYAKVGLSPRALDLTGLAGETWEPREFDRVMGLARLAPNPRDDAGEIRTITAYCRVMRIAGSLLAPFSRTAREWIRQELSRCTYFAVVTLDRRLLRSVSLG